VNIRCYERGDENSRVAIYNEAAAQLPKFKPATVDEVRRRYLAPDFDPQTRFFATENGSPVGYILLNANGRLSYPWYRGDHEGLCAPLLDRALQAAREKGLATVFAAYRGDWKEQCRFFLEHGFREARQMVNFVVDLADMPTPAARPSSLISPLRPEDLPAILQLAPEALRARTPAELEAHFYQNPHLKADDAFVLRRRMDGPPIAVGVLVSDPAYANPKQLDAAMPCYRLGAFGTEGMQTKRVNGLFSFLAGGDPSLRPLALDLMGQAAFRLQKGQADALAAQVPSDAPHLLRFYQQYFRQQGSFPVFERAL
jgi:hypothetical protein